MVKSNVVLVRLVSILFLPILIIGLLGPFYLSGSNSLGPSLYGAFCMALIGMYMSSMSHFVLTDRDRCSNVIVLFCLSFGALLLLTIALTFLLNLSIFDHLLPLLSFFVLAVSILITSVRFQRILDAFI